MNDELKIIPLDQIRTLNPRHRDMKRFAMIVQSIKNQGLKKPIQVSEREADEGEGPAYDLVCGQGRIEAFQALGYNEIPAVVVRISKEDRLLRSLAENMARRNPAPIEMLTEIERLKKEGLTLREIGARIDMDPTSVRDLITLKKAGEIRLLDAAFNGKIPVSVAVEIARTEGIEMQRELLKACENRQLTQNALRMIRRVMDRRRLIGKQRGNGPRSSKQPRLSADSLVNAYRRESDKQRLMVKKARVCEAKLFFMVTALRRLLALKQLGWKTVEIIVASEDDRFTYNARVNRLPPIQAHKMIVKAVKNGVKPERIAKALFMPMETVNTLLNLLDGVNPEATELLRDKHITAEAIRLLRKVTGLRQIEIAEVMVSANNFTKAYAEALVLATPKDQMLSPHLPKKKTGMTAEELARMEREMEALEKDFKSIEANYTENMMSLTLGRGYVKRLLENSRVLRHLREHHGEMLPEFEAMAAAEGV